MTIRTQHQAHNRLIGRPITVYSRKLRRNVPGRITDTTNGAIHVSPAFAHDLYIEDWISLAAQDIADYLDELREDDRR